MFVRLFAFLAARFQQNVSVLPHYAPVLFPRFTLRLAYILLLACVFGVSVQRPALAGKKQGALAHIVSVVFDDSDIYSGWSTAVTITLDRPVAGVSFGDHYTSAINPQYGGGTIAGTKFRMLVSGNGVAKDSVGTLTIELGYGGDPTPVSAYITVHPVFITLACSPAVALYGQTVTAIVGLNHPLPNDFRIPVSTSLGYATSLLLPANTSSASWSFPANGVGQQNVSAELPLNLPPFNLPPVYAYFTVTIQAWAEDTAHCPQRLAARP